MSSVNGLLIRFVNFSFKDRKKGVKRVVRATSTILGKALRDLCQVATVRWETAEWDTL